MSNLHYTKEKGLFKSNLAGETLVIMPHYEDGWKKIVEDLPETDVQIRISTNFGYPKQAYFRGSIYINGKVLPNFIGNNYRDSIQNISCDPEKLDWDEMFDKLIVLYESRFNSESIVNNYFCNIENSFNAAFDECKNSDKDLFKLLLDYSEKLIGIKKVVDESVLSDSNCLAKGLLMICGKMLSLYLDKCNSIGEKNKDVFGKFEENLRELMQYIADKRLILELCKNTRRSRIG